MVGMYKISVEDGNFDLYFKSQEKAIDKFIQLVKVDQWISFTQLEELQKAIDDFRAAKKINITLSFSILRLDFCLFED